MTKRICHLIGHTFSQFQAFSGHFVKKKLSSILGFKEIYQQSRNNNPKGVYFPSNINNNV